MSLNVFVQNFSSVWALWILRLRSFYRLKAVTKWGKVVIFNAKKLQRCITNLEISYGLTSKKTRVASVLIIPDPLLRPETDPRPIGQFIQSCMNRAWSCAVYFQFISDLCINYVILMWSIHRIHDMKVIHRWKSLLDVDQLWKTTNLDMNLTKITHNCLRFM